MVLKVYYPTFRNSGDIYDTVRRQFGHDLSHHCTVLGLEAGAGVAEGKKAYRKLAAEDHPDKAVSKGLLEDFTRFPEQKQRGLRDDYKRQCRLVATGVFSF